MKETNQIQSYLTYEAEKKRFKLNKISIFWDIEWVYPFMFRNFPPLILEIFVLTLVIPYSFLIGNESLSLLSSGSSGDLTTDAFAIIATIILVLLVFYLIRRIIQDYSRYNRIKYFLIERQKVKIFQLVQQKEDASVIIMNQNNLNRLNLMGSFPLPAIFRIAPFIPPIVISVLGVLFALIWCSENRF